MRRPLLVLLLIAGVAQASEPGDLVLKALIVNPSDKETQKVPVELPLPREARKKDVIDLTEGLDVRFDSDQGVYKTVGEFTLGPGEQKKIQVKIRDVWRIPEKDIQFQQGYLPTLLQVLEKTKYAETARQLGEAVKYRLEDILASQAETVSPSKHIAIFRENTTLFNDIKKDIRFLEKLAGDKVPVADSALEVESGAQGRGSPADSVRTIALKILVKNPSATEKALLPVDYYLPREVTEKDVLDPGELEARYDVSRGAVFLHKAEVPLEGGESKIFPVVLRDLWHIDPEMVKALEVKTAGVAQGFQGTQFEPATQNMKNALQRLVKEMMEIQINAEGKPVEDHIAAFVENLSLLSQMKEMVVKLERIETVSAASPQTTPDILGLETPSEGDVQAGVSDTPGKRGPEILARTVFAGKALDETTTWRLIFAIIGFLGFVSLLFYIRWWTQLKAEPAMAHQNGGERL